MCVIIDTNSLTSVFDDASQNHHEFKPILDWIINKKGMIVFGGTKYCKEAIKYIGLFNELKILRKSVYIQDDLVDEEEIKAAKKVQHRDFNDQHLVGLLVASKCKVICSGDKKAFRFLTDTRFYAKGNKPKIYRGKGNKDLLIEKHIAGICMPCKMLNKAQRQLIENLIK